MMLRALQHVQLHGGGFPGLTSIPCVTNTVRTAAGTYMLRKNLVQKSICENDYSRNYLLGDTVKLQENYTKTGRVDLQKTAVSRS